MTYVKEYEDDPSIVDADRLWRRLYPKQIVFDPDLQCWRPSSSAFSDSSNGTAMSVNIVRLRLSDSPVEFPADRPEGGLAEFTAGIARSLNQGVDRTPEEGGPDHGSVYDKSGKRSRATKTKLAEACLLVRDPGETAR